MDGRLDGFPASVISSKLAWRTLFSRTITSCPRVSEDYKLPTFCILSQHADKMSALLTTSCPASALRREPFAVPDARARPERFSTIGQSARFAAAFVPG